MSRMLSKMDSTDGKMSEVFELELDHPIAGDSSHNSRNLSTLRYESDDDAIEMDQVRLFIHELPTFQPGNEIQTFITTFTCVSRLLCTSLM